WANEPALSQCNVRPCETRYSTTAARSSQCGQILETLKGNTAKLCKLQILTLGRSVRRAGVARRANPGSNSMPRNIDFHAATGASSLSSLCAGTNRWPFTGADRARLCAIVPWPGGATFVLLPASAALN